MGTERTEEKRCIRVSVRSLVEFVMRSGDIDNRRMAVADKDAMQAGSRIHRKIQRQMGAGYRAEVPVKRVVDEGKFCLLVEGRADGVMTEAEAAASDGGKNTAEAAAPDVVEHGAMEAAGFGREQGAASDGRGRTRVLIDEIKGVYRDLEKLEEPAPVHLAQAMCYGYLYCADHGIPAVTVQVTYCNMETEEIRRFANDYTFEELEEWFGNLIREYVKWAEYLYEHGVSRDRSLKALEFPYEYRQGQKELAVSVYRAVSRRRNLFIQAPTGVGKTLSVVYPGLKAMGEGLVEKLFYLTAKTITRSVAEETFSILREKGMILNSVTITAKEKLCFLETPSCNPEDCPYAKGHFDRVNGAVYEIIHRESGITRETVLAYAEKFRVCPFEFCLDISSWADAVICDYNYVFDPNVRLKRYFADGAGGEYLFLVDEAHNLVSRGREMYSARLIKEDVLLAKKLLRGRSARLTKLAERVNRQLLDMKRESGGCVVRETVKPLAGAVQSLCGGLETFLEENRQFEGRDSVLEFYFELRNFLLVLGEADESYIIYSELLEDGRFMVRLFCVNPASHLKDCLEKGRSTVFFSATLLPVNYYKELLSGNPDDYAVYAESPFPEENREILVAEDVSSRYTRRGPREYEKVADYIRKTVTARPGNYMVFFPSYAYMNEVAALWEQMMNERPESGITWILQDSRMSERKREEFLEAFEIRGQEDLQARGSRTRQNRRTLVAFCVMGGMFSEGIDLKADRLIGVIVVGTGLPMVCTEQELLRQYFDKQNRKGFDYAYRYPGMNKVMQAAGRVIRTMEDRGVILLLDDRFLQEEYQALFPREWRLFRVVNRRNVEPAVRSFWDRQTAGQG